jgi:hypothetical protein
MESQNTNKGVHINIVENKSLIIIQLKASTYLHQIMNFEKLKKISEGHFFYLNNRKLSLSSKLDKGNHFIHIYSKLPGGARTDWWDILNKLDLEYEWNEKIGDEIIMEDYYRGRSYEYNYFVRLGIFEDKRKVLRYVDQALDILKIIERDMEKKGYDDPRDPEVPHLDPMSPFEILRHSPIKYADVFRRITETMKEENESYLPLTIQEKKNQLIWKNFYESAAWCDKVRNSYD